MADKNIRLGKVSSVDYKNGMISVTYPDLDDNTTDKLPVFSMCDEYKIPPIGAEVLVLHLSNGCTAGVVMGRYWNQGNKPAVSGKNVFRKELGQAQGEAYVQYMNKNITIKDGNGNSTTLASILQRLSALEAKI